MHHALDKLRIRTPRCGRGSSGSNPSSPGSNPAGGAGVPRIAAPIRPREGVIRRRKVVNAPHCGHDNPGSNLAGDTWSTPLEDFRLRTPRCGRGSPDLNSSGPGSNPVGDGYSPHCSAHSIHGELVRRRREISTSYCGHDSPGSNLACDTWGSAKRVPAIAQLVEHLTVERSRYQMVPGSIPGGRRGACRGDSRAEARICEELRG